MEHLITFLSMLGTITLVMIVLLLIGRGFSILAKKEKIKLTKARVWLIYMLVTNISEDQNDLSNHKTHH
jgi:hypothetical protein